MQNYDSKSIVSKGEVEALKDMIFKRARERAEALAKNTQEQYTTSFKNELMDIARDSFTRSTGNPFAPKEVKHEDESESAAKDETKEIGFSVRKIPSNIESSIEYKNKIIKEAIANNELESVMKNAGIDFSNKRSFVGALNFLNSQASLSLINNKKNGFDAIA